MDLWHAQLGLDQRVGHGTFQEKEAGFMIVEFDERHLSFEDQILTTPIAGIIKPQH